MASDNVASNSSDSSNTPMLQGFLKRKRISNGLTNGLSSSTTPTTPNGAPMEPISETSAEIQAPGDDTCESNGDNSSDTVDETPSSVRAHSPDKVLDDPIADDHHVESETTVKDEALADDKEDTAPSENPAKKRRLRRTGVELLEAATALYLNKQPLKDKKAATEAVAAATPVETVAPVKKRGFGRPPKNAAAKTTAAKAKPVTARATAPTPAKKKRGRPAANTGVKKPAAEPDVKETAVKGDGVVKRGRGRPPKAK